MRATTLPFRREIEGVGKMLDVRTYLARAALGSADATAALARAGLVGDLLTLDVDCTITGSGAVKAAEVAAVIAGDGKVAPPHRALRVSSTGRTRSAASRRSRWAVAASRAPRSPSRPWRRRPAPPSDRACAGPLQRPGAALAETRGRSRRRGGRGLRRASGHRVWRLRRALVRAHLLDERLDGRRRPLSRCP